MGIPFFVVFVFSIGFLSLGFTGGADFVSVQWARWESLDGEKIFFIPHLNFRADYWAMARCFAGFLLFFTCLYSMGFFLYLEERESGRIMKNVKSFVKLRQLLERFQKKGTPR